jgi:hypothetical protein
VEGMLCEKICKEGIILDFELPGCSDAAAPLGFDNGTPINFLYNKSILLSLIVGISYILYYNI